MLEDSLTLSLEEFLDKHSDKDIRTEGDSIAVKFEPKNIDKRKSTRCTLTSFIHDDVVRFQLRYEFDGSATFDDVHTVLNTLEDTIQEIQEKASDRNVTENSGDNGDVFSIISFEDYTLVFEAVFSKNSE